MKLKDNAEVEMEYLDDNQHQLFISTKCEWFSFTMTKGEVNDLIHLLIEYTQKNEEWKE